MLWKLASNMWGWHPSIFASHVWSTALKIPDEEGEIAILRMNSSQLTGILSCLFHLPPVMYISHCLSVKGSPSMSCGFCCSTWYGQILDASPFMKTSSTFQDNCSKIRKQVFNVSQWRPPLLEWLLSAKCMLCCSLLWHLLGEIICCHVIDIIIICAGANSAWRQILIWMDLRMQEKACIHSTARGFWDCTRAGVAATDWANSSRWK